MKKALIVLGCLLAIVVIAAFVSYLGGISLFSPQVRIVAGMQEVPVYPNARLISSTSEPISEGTKYEGVWQSRDSVSKVSAWYKNSILAEGWVLHTEPSSWVAEDIQYIVFKKNDISLNLSLERNKSNGQTKITVDEVPAAQEEEAGE